MLRYLLFALCLVTTSSTYAQVKPSMAKIQWLVGSWKLPKPFGYLQETWMQTNDSTLSGTVVMHRPNGTTKNLEEIQIRIRGLFAYFMPTAYGQNGNNAITFPIVQLASGAFRAENMKHDYPQVITYTQTSDSTLTVVLEGKDGEGQSREELKMQRMR